MKIKHKIASVAIVAVALALAGAFYLRRTNDLGLAGLDALLGERPDMDMLRTNTKAAADAFLANHKNELASPSTGRLELVVDYSKTSKIRSLGYRSSFYYYHWDIYIPYSVRTTSGENYTVVVQVSDVAPAHAHDPQHFHVVRVILLDGLNRTIRTLDG